VEKNYAITFGGMSVLVVDDSRNMRRILTQLLRSFGFVDIRYAGDGQAALEELRIGGVDIAILDWHMKPMNGLDFIRQIRSEATSPDPFLPIIMLTGFSELARVKLARDCGVNEILTKPVSPEALYARLTSIVRQPRPYVETRSFFGPDRRRREAGKFQGPYRRRRDGSPSFAALEVNNGTR
jgi:DNA-binding response OmpR family regulator